MADKPDGVSEFDVDLLTIIGRLEQISALGFEDSMSQLLFTTRVIACDLPRLRKYVSGPALEYYAKFKRDEGMEPTAADLSQISDGFHTFGELYAHRSALLLALMRQAPDLSWKSRLHHDGTMFEGGWFIAGMHLPEGDISYHLSTGWWDQYADVRELDRAPVWDGHTPAQVVLRLAAWGLPI